MGSKEGCSLKPGETPGSVYLLNVAPMTADKISNYEPEFLESGKNKCTTKVSKDIGVFTKVL